MLKTSFALVLTMISMSLLMTGCVTRAEDDANLPLDNKSITLRVKKRLHADAMTQNLIIAVNTSNRNVQLAGFVESKAQELQALSIAQHTPGVLSVKDDLVIHTPGQ